MAPEMMMIFVGTEHKRGKQFHVWVNQYGTSEDLVEAICLHERLSPNSFILQHKLTSDPIIPFQPLRSQDILPYSVVHLYYIDDLRGRELKRKAEQKEEYEKRGRYMSKVDGKMKLRRRSKLELEQHRRKEKQKERGDGLLPCYKEFWRGALGLGGNIGIENFDIDIDTDLDIGFGQAEKGYRYAQGVSINGHRYEQPRVSGSRNNGQKKEAKQLLTSKPLLLSPSKKDGWTTSSKVSNTGSPDPMDSSAHYRRHTTTSISLRSPSGSSYTLETGFGSESSHSASSDAKDDEESPIPYRRIPTPQLPQHPKDIDMSVAGPSMEKYWQGR
ncbi:hypothetical protein L486_02333 [Kwoniella mangroviensis CBS 10435]|uniref:Uncharacterized protein n=1 Tax=Kwoniella mangroviensis CBS 10435 TaxID=1331196 RepID=A0A1B9IVV4_9TREE|nr:hypothetical protein L486_02333 [Kwoniella mangroviensis CBS 10435]